MSISEKDKKKKSAFFNWAFITLILVLTIYLITQNVDAKEFFSIIEGADAKYFLFGLLCVFIYWALEIFMIHSLLRSVYKHIKPFVSLKAVMVGQYYSHLTPFASGSQPMQVLYMGRDKVSVSDSTAVLVNKFLLFQITVTIFAFVTALMQIGIVMTDLKQASTFVIVGLTINIVGLTLIILMAYKPHFITKILNFVIYVLTRIRIIKNPNKKYVIVRNTINDYLKCFKYLLKDKKKLAILFLASLVQVIFFFSIPWFVYLGLGLSGTDYMYVVSMAALLYIAVSFIPIPGAAGASEIGFAVILGRIFTGGYMAAGLLLWRGISFYFSFIFCGLFTLGIHAFDKGEKEKLEKVDI